MLVKATLPKTGDILLQHVGFITVCCVFCGLFKVDCDSVEKTLGIKIKLCLEKFYMILNSKSGKVGFTW